MRNRNVSVLAVALVGAACVGCGGSPDGPPLSDHERAMLALARELTSATTTSVLGTRLPAAGDPVATGPVTVVPLDTALFGVDQHGQFTFAGDLLVQFAFEAEQLPEPTARELYRRYAAGLDGMFGRGKESRTELAGMTMRSRVWREDESRIMLLLAAVPDEGWSVVWGTQLLPFIPRERFDGMEPSSGRSPATPPVGTPRASSAGIPR